MGFIAGVWRLLGADEAEGTNANIVDYPAANNHAGTAAPALSLSGSSETSLSNTVSTVYTARPELDSDGQQTFKMKQYAAYLLSNQVVILDVNSIAAVDQSQAARIVDYLCGVTEAIHGSVNELTKNIFLFTPAGMSIAGDPITPIEVL
jgi:FtsZ-interacting cell division protein YlmF